MNFLLPAVRQFVVGETCTNILFSSNVLVIFHASSTVTCATFLPNESFLTFFPLVQ